MAGDVVNIKICSPLKLRNGLTGSTTQSATHMPIVKAAC